jgi:hypothetical protein
MRYFPLSAFCYRPKRLGEQKTVIINTLHPFYTNVYDATSEIKAALEVLVLVLGMAELEAKANFASYDSAARTRWSERLYHALNAVLPDEVMRQRTDAALA